MLAHHSLLNTVCKESYCILSSQCSVSQLSFLFDLNFHAHFSLFLCLTDFILTFEILIKFTITNDYFILCCALLEKFFICSVLHCILFSCLRFQSSLLLQADIQSHAAFSEK